mmetsp:Transcript_52382/g.157194  ORF Transcript_52382/g.157194 Transcript_52382/m.157194 type:complete len:129 (+) Transcript_52382:1953-2339(+)
MPARKSQPSRAVSGCGLPFSDAANADAWKSNDASALALEQSDAGFQTLRTQYQHIWQRDSDSTDRENEFGPDDHINSPVGQVNMLWLGLVFNLLKESLLLFEACVVQREDCTKRLSLSGKNRPCPGLA